MFSRPAGAALPADLTAAKTAFGQIGTLYNSASAFIRTKRHNSLALFQLNPDGDAGEAKFRAVLASIMAAANGPTAFAVGTPTTTVKLSLVPIFNGTANFAQLAPAFYGDLIIGSSIPDPTFGGIFASGNASFWKKTSNESDKFIPFGPAIIATQPAGVTAAAGSNVTLTASLSVTTNVSYYWTLNNLYIQDGGSYTGTGTPQLKITGLNGNLTGTYRLLVVTPVGVSSSTGAVVSIPAVSTKPVAPTIGGQPSNTTLVAGAQATFTVLANGTGPFTYQWTFNGKALANGGNITGAKSAQLVINNVTTANVGKYAVTVTNLKGKATSNTVTLAVVAALVAPSIVTQPMSPVAEGENIAAGTMVSLTVKASGSATLTYQWQFNGRNLSNGGIVSGATTATLNLSSVTTGNTGTYLVNVTNGAGTQTSNPVTLTVVRSIWSN